MSTLSQMNALLLLGDGYDRGPADSQIKSLEPFLRRGTIDVPSPTGRQLLIKVSLAAINPSDVMFIQGAYGQPRAQGQPAGFEGVGEVVATGDDPMAQWFSGKRVAFATGLSNWGSWADYAIADAFACIPIVENIRDEDAAAMIVNPLTAIAMFGIVKDEGHKSFVMTAGASQLSKLICGLAREAGYHPVVTVRRDDQIDMLKEAGAKHVLNHASPDFEARMRDVFKEEQPRVFLDAQTGPVASAIFHHMGKRARWIIYGRLDGAETVIREPGQLIFAGKKVEGFWLTEWMRQDKARREAAVLDAQKRFADGRWATDVTAVVPLAEAIARVPAELAKPNGKVFIKP
jgi:NADPH:quinone reductase-like Zn-dependent oxidoreductase